MHTIHSTGVDRTRSPCGLHVIICVSDQCAAREQCASPRDRRVVLATRFTGWHTHYCQYIILCFQHCLVTRSWFYVPGICLYMRVLSTKIVTSPTFIDLIITSYRQIYFTTCNIFASFAVQLPSECVTPSHARAHARPSPPLFTDRVPLGLDPFYVLVPTKKLIGLLYGGGGCQLNPRMVYSQHLYPNQNRL